MKRNAVWMLLLTMLYSACKAQPSSPFAPEAGAYKGSSTTVGTSYQYGYNGVTGFGIQTTPQIQNTQSPMGDLIITATGSNKGTYSFTKMSNLSGSWQYNPEKEQLVFTGFLKDALRYYKAGKGFFTISLQVKPGAANKETLYYTYSKKASKPFPPLAKPNGSLTGNLVIKPDFKTVAVLDIQTGKITRSFNGTGIACGSTAGTITSVGFTTDPHYYEIKIVTAGNNSNSLTPEYLKGLNWTFHEYKFAVLNHTGTKMALPGKTFDSYANLNYQPGYYAIAVTDVSSGKILGLLPLKNSAFIRPHFLADNRLVYSPDTDGIAITSSNYSQHSTIYKNPVNALAVSPNGKSIAFSEGIYFYTINADGSNKKQLTSNGEPVTVDKGENVADMCWSPDGNYIALCVLSGSNYKIAAVPLDGSSYRIIRDAEGEDVGQINPVISWQ